MGKEGKLKLALSIVAMLAGGSIAVIGGNMSGSNPIGEMPATGAILSFIGLTTFAIGMIAILFWLTEE